jgi:hypothetical protein
MDYFKEFTKSINNKENMVLVSNLLGRGTGKSTALVKLSLTTGCPILVANYSTELSIRTKFIKLIKERFYYLSENMIDLLCEDIVNKNIINMNKRQYLPYFKSNVFLVEEGFDYDFFKKEIVSRKDNTVFVGFAYM